MNEVKNCPYCGSNEIILIDEGKQEYKCHACLSMFIGKKSEKKNELQTESPSNVKRKMFFEKLMAKTMELNCYFDIKCVAGTGFFVSEEYMLTNAHVVLRDFESSDVSNVAMKITGKDYSKKKLFEFDVVSLNKNLDIAILKANGVSKDIVTFSQNVYNGEQVYAIGNSHGEGLCILEGIISDASRVIGSNRYFMTSAIVTNGNSGCPLFSNEGFVVGMITEGSVNSVAMNYAIPSDTLINYIKKVEKEEEVTIL